MHAILTAQSSPALIAALELIPAPMWTSIDENRLNVLEQALAADERLTRGRADLMYVTGDLVEGFETIWRDVDGPPLRRWLIDVNFTEIADLDLEPGDEFDPAMLFDVRGVDAIEPAVDQGRPA